ncbi:MAG: hypothetical protein H0W88_04630 [Parachlamydiaceae bacterium]|nr:hypothetical protein [Parachlamydiaceae bacterium]
MFAISSFNIWGTDLKTLREPSGNMLFYAVVLKDKEASPTISKVDGVRVHLRECNCDTIPNEEYFKDLIQKGLIVSVSAEKQFNIFSKVDKAASERMFCLTLSNSSKVNLEASKCSVYVKRAVRNKKLNLEKAAKYFKKENKQEEKKAAVVEENKNSGKKLEEAKDISAAIVVKTAPEKPAGASLPQHNAKQNERALEGKRQIPVGGPAVHETKQGEKSSKETTVYKLIDGKIYKMKDGKPVERVFIRSWNKELKDEYIKLYIEKVEYGEIASKKLNTKQNALLAEKDVFTKEKNLIDQEKIRLNDEKNKLLAEIAFLEKLNSENESRLNEGSSSTTKLLDRDYHKDEAKKNDIKTRSQELSQQLKSNSDEMVTLEKRLAEYTTNSRAFVIRWKAFQKEVQEFIQKRKTLNEQIAQNQKKWKKIKKVMLKSLA